MRDGFQKPYPFIKDIAVIIDEGVDQKIEALASHESQMVEWGSWTQGVSEEDVPKGTTERRSWLKKQYAAEKEWSPEEREAIKKWYPGTDPSQVKYAEFFEICEYGKQPTEEEIKTMFPMIGKK